jgi:hypothetical protein
MAGVSPSEIGVDGSVCCRYQHPTWFAFSCRCGNNCSEIAATFSTFDRAKVFMKLRRVKVSKTACYPLYRVRLAEVTWEAIDTAATSAYSVQQKGIFRTELKEI